MGKKYKLTDDTRKYYGHTIYRIKALKDFGDVKKGDLGGWVESEDNLSQEGDCWVYDNAKVFDTARVCDNAQMHGSSRLLKDSFMYGDAKIFDNVWVSDASVILGTAKVHNNSHIYGRAVITGDAIVNKSSDYKVFKNDWRDVEVPFHFTYTNSNKMWYVPRPQEVFYGAGGELVEETRKDKDEGSHYKAYVTLVNHLYKGLGDATRMKYKPNDEIVIKLDDATASYLNEEGDLDFVDEDEIVGKVSELFKSKKIKFTEEEKKEFDNLVSGMHDDGNEDIEDVQDILNKIENFDSSYYSNLNKRLYDSTPKDNLRAQFEFVKALEHPELIEVVKKEKKYRLLIMPVTQDYLAFKDNKYVLSSKDKAKVFTEEELRQLDNGGFLYNVNLEKCKEEIK